MKYIALWFLAGLMMGSRPSYTPDRAVLAAGGLDMTWGLQGFALLHALLATAQVLVR